MEEKILALAVELGRVEENERLKVLCQAASEELTAMLKPGLKAEDCGGAFPLAAAWMALGSLAAAQDDGVTSFTAGEVSLKKEGGRRREALRLQAAQVMRPYLRDGGFVFKGVRC